MTGKLAITVIMPEAEALAVIQAAEAAGQLVDPRTVAIDGFVMISKGAFERLLEGLRTGLQDDRGGGEGEAGTGAAQARSGGPVDHGGEQA